MPFTSVFIGFRPLQLAGGHVFPSKETGAGEPVPDRISTFCVEDIRKIRFHLDFYRLFERCDIF